MAEIDGNKLRRVRGERALSLRELGERSGVSADTILRIEQGRRRAPWPRTVRRLAEALGVDPKDLIKEE